MSVVRLSLCVWMLLAVFYVGNTYATHEGGASDTNHQQVLDLSSIVVLPPMPGILTPVGYWYPFSPYRTIEFEKLESANRVTKKTHTQRIVPFDRIYTIPGINYQLNTRKIVENAFELKTLESNSEIAEADVQILRAQIAQEDAQRFNRFLKGVMAVSSVSTIVFGAAGEVLRVVTGAAASNATHAAVNEFGDLTRAMLEKSHEIMSRPEVSAETAAAILEYGTSFAQGIQNFAPAFKSVLEEAAPSPSHLPGVCEFVAGASALVLVAATGTFVYYAFTSKPTSQRTQQPEVIITDGNVSSTKSFFGAFCNRVTGVISWVFATPVRAGITSFIFGCTSMATLQYLGYSPLSFVYETSHAVSS